MIALRDIEVMACGGRLCDCLSVLQYFLSSMILGRATEVEAGAEVESCGKAVEKNRGGKIDLS